MEVLLISSAGIICILLKSVLFFIILLYEHVCCLNAGNISASRIFLVLSLFCGMLCDAEEFVHLRSYEVLLWEMLSRFLFNLFLKP
jgi:hypothetical protein